MQRLTARLESVSAFSAALADSGWWLDFRQLERGAETVDVDAAMAPGMMLMRVDLGGRVQQQALAPSGTVTFGLPTGPQAPGRMGRRPLESETLTCFHPELGMDAVSEAGFSAYTLSFAAQELMQLAQTLGLSAPGQDKSLFGEQRYPQPAALLSLRRKLQAFFACQNPGAAENFMQELALETLQAYAPAEPLAYVPASNRNRALRRALSHIRERPQEVISVTELCRVSASSISTLERAFREHFGMSPKQYLITVRLNGARRELLQGGRRAVGDIATDWGFWHLSKFAADYKRMFGELPSQTQAA